MIPKPLLGQLGLGDEDSAELTVEGDALVLRKPTIAVRKGWGEAAREIAEVGDDVLLMGKFGNESDRELAW